jgi:hypothetical protein
MHARKNKVVIRREDNGFNYYLDDDYNSLLWYGC